jgi:hypothetical protein
MNATWISVCRPKGVPVSLQLLPAGRHDLTSPAPLNPLAGVLKAPYCARLYKHELAIQVDCVLVALLIQHRRSDRLHGRDYSI